MFIYDLRLNRKHVVDFLIVLIELFRLALRRHERISIENRRFCSNGVRPKMSCRYNCCPHQQYSSCRKTNAHDILTRNWYQKLVPEYQNLVPVSMVSMSWSHGLMGIRQHSESKRWYTHYTGAKVLGNHGAKVPFPGAKRPGSERVREGIGEGAKGPKFQGVNSIRGSSSCSLVDRARGKNATESSDGLIFVMFSLYLLFFFLINKELSKS